MGDVTLNINGRDLSIACDDGQEQRVVDLGHYIDGRVREIEASGAARNEVHLLVLASLMMADEIFDLRDYIHQSGQDMPRDEHTLKQEDLAIAEAIENLAARIETVAERVQSA